MLKKKIHTNIILHLSLIPNIGPAAVLKIIRVLYDEFCQTHEHPEITKPTFDLEKLYSYKKNDFVHTFGVSERIAQLLVTGLSNKKVLDEEITLIEKYNITLLSFLDEQYPETLKQIYHPPLVLYCKGAQLDNTAKKLAIVGSRKADSYAKQCIKTLVSDMIQSGWQIVSGGAAGVDSMAHAQTMQQHGKTIAVFGAGLTNPYPASNKELFRSIVKSGGTLVSPFSLKTPPSKGNFPSRNRIISGLSDGCLVVQAAQKSGALITAKFALDQGKQIFAIPGEIDNKLSVGCHALIQQGAKLVTNTNDILEEFGQEINVVATQQLKKEKQETHPILKHLDNPAGIDELTHKTGLELSELQTQLFTLQIEGKVMQNIAGLWEKV